VSPPPRPILDLKWQREFAAALGAGFHPEKRQPIPCEYRRLLRERDGHKCQLCQTRIDFSLTEGPWRVTFDHITEKKSGGSDELGNLQLAHWYCNEAKSNPMPPPPPRPPRRRYRQRRKPHPVAVSPQITVTSPQITVTQTADITSEWRITSPQVA